MNLIKSLLAATLVCASTGVAHGQTKKTSNPRNGPLAPKTEQHLTIFAVSVSSPSFNPSQNETIRLVYRLSREARVTVRIFDCDRFLVRELASGAVRKAGQNSETWDGKDLGRKVVPNEAYFFEIEADVPGSDHAVYDPVTFSGGEPFDITESRVSQESGTIEYKLSQPSRALLRVGQSGSALFRTIVDWQPRAAGTITEYWNGKDESGFVNLFNRKSYTMVLSYFTLPDASVITTGNAKYGYAEYRAGWQSSRLRKPDRPMANLRKISPHFTQSRLTDRSFRVNVSFPEIEKSGRLDLPAVPQGEVLARIEISPGDRAVLQNQRFEVILFTDGEFHIEDEWGYLPLNIPWDLKQLPPGEHLLTVNIATMNDQFGVGTRKVKVVK
jgi:flagellar hook assembly protein FlgD